jgi:hypothetical protein
MAKKVLSPEAAERVNTAPTIEELEGYKLGEEVWARLSDGAVAFGKITMLHSPEGGKAATLYDTIGSKYRTVPLGELSREQIKGRRKSKGRGAAAAGVGSLIKLRLRPEETA